MSIHLRDTTLVVPHLQPPPAAAVSVTMPPSGEQSEAGGLPQAVRMAWLVVLGALAPWIVVLAIALTLLLGRVAFLAGPVLGTWISFVLGRHCRRQAPPRCFWIYPVSALAEYGLFLLLVFLPGKSHSSASEPSLAGGQAAMAGGIVLLLILGSALCWLLGVVFAIASRRDDTEEPIFP